MKHQKNPIHNLEKQIGKCPFFTDTDYWIIFLETFKKKVYEILHRFPLYIPEVFKNI